MFRWKKLYLCAIIFSIVCLIGINTPTYAEKPEVIPAETIYNIEPKTGKEIDVFDPHVIYADDGSIDSLLTCTFDFSADYPQDFYDEDGIVYITLKHQQTGLVFEVELSCIADYRNAMNAPIGYWEIVDLYTNKGHDFDASVELYSFAVRRNKDYDIIIKVYDNRAFLESERQKGVENGIEEPIDVIEPAPDSEVSSVVDETSEPENAVPDIVSDIASNISPAAEPEPTSESETAIIEQPKSGGEIATKVIVGCAIAFIAVVVFAVFYFRIHHKREEDK